MTLPLYPPPEGDLPPQQARVLAFLQEHVLRHGRFPTHREIADHMGWRAEGSAYDCLCRLHWRGLLRRVDIASSRIARTRSQRYAWELA